MKLPKLPWWAYVLAATALCLLLWFVISGGWVKALIALLAGGAAIAKGTAATAGKIVNDAAEAVGAKPIPKNDTGRGRRPGPSAVSPAPKEGEKRARPRLNRGRR